MTTESELRNFIKLAEEHLEEAKDNLHKLLAKPKIKVYKNMPVIANGEKRYASHLASDGGLWFYCDGSNSYTSDCGAAGFTQNWQPDYERRSLLNWRPVDETIPEHGLWLLKFQDESIWIRKLNKHGIIRDYPGHECLPLYEETE